MGLHLETIRSLSRLSRLTKTSEEGGVCILGVEEAGGCKWDAGGCRRDRDTYLSLCQGPDGWEGQQATHASTPPRLDTLQTEITNTVSQHMQAHDHALYTAAFHAETHRHKLL